MKMTRSPSRRSERSDHGQQQSAASAPWHSRHRWRAGISQPLGAEAAQACPWTRGDRPGKRVLQQSGSFLTRFASNLPERRKCATWAGLKEYTGPQDDRQLLSLTREESQDELRRALHEGIRSILVTGGVISARLTVSCWWMNRHVTTSPRISPPLLSASRTGEHVLG